MNNFAATSISWHISPVEGIVRRRSFFSRKLKGKAIKFSDRKDRTMIQTHQKEDAMLIS